MTELYRFIKENNTGIKKSSNINIKNKVLTNINDNDLNKTRHPEKKK